MSTFLSGIERVFLAVWEISWQASLLALAVLLIQWLFRRWLNPRWRSALWLLVLARLLLPVLPEAPWSAHGVVPAPVWESAALPIRAEPVLPAPLPAPVPTPDVRPTLFQFLALVWLAGVLAWGAVSVVVNLRFARLVRRLPEVEHRVCG